MSVTTDLTNVDKSYSSIPAGTFSLGSPGLDTVGVIDGNPALESVIKTSGAKSNGSEMQERLFFTRPRYASNSKTDRGTHGFIKLLTSTDQASEYSSGSSSRTTKHSANYPDSSVQEALATMSGSSQTGGYDKFIITNVQAQIEEKLQIVEVFGDTEVAYYFGRMPMIFTISGMLIDSPDNNWFSSWLQVYAGVLRGTELARNFELLKIVLPNMTIVGSMTSFSWSQESTNDVNVPFQFRFLVKSLIPTPATALGEISNAAQSISFDAEQTFTTWSEINSLRQQGATLAGLIQTPGSSPSSIAGAAGALGTGLPASMGLRATSSGVSDFIDGLTSGFQSGMSSLTGVFSPIINGLNGIRSSLFSPIYGVMNSLTKLVKTVFGASGVMSIFNALTTPIRNILGDLARIATQAAAIATLVTAGITGLGRGIASGFGILQSYESTVRAFKHAAGTIAVAPLSIGRSVKNLVNSGFIPTHAAFLQADTKHSLSRPAVLGSGTKKKTGMAAILTSPVVALSPQLAIISKSSSIYNPADGASL